MILSSRLLLVLLLLSVVTACDEDASNPGGSDTQQVDTGSVDITPDTPDTSSTACGQVPTADRDRFVVVAHPYLDAPPPDNRANAYGVYRLTASGELSDTGSRFDMGRTPWGTLHFTPDGRTGLVAQEDGTLGVFQLDAQGQPTVVHTGYADGFYAQDLVVLPDGDAIYVLDGNFRNNGGGIFRVDLACDGTLSNPTKLVESKLAQGLVLLSNGRAAIAARDVIEEPAQAYVHLVTLEPTPTYHAGADVFGDDEASLSAFALTQDEQFLFAGDSSGFSSVPNRMGIARIDGDTLTPLQVLSPLSDPISVVTSPFDNTAIILAIQGDAIFRVTYDEANTTAPFAIAGELDYTGGGPALPGSAAMIRRGPLEGRVLIAENVAIRQVQFNPDGTVTDLGPLAAQGSGSLAITGAIGVQP